MSADPKPVEVRLFGPLREIVGRRSVTVPYAGMALRDALARFAEERGTVIGHMLFDSQGKRRPSIICLLNDETVEDEGQKLQSGDVISVLFPLAGG